MPWNDYHNSAQAEIDATEDRVDETWDEAWLLLLLLSSRLRATLVRAALGVDLNDRRSVVRFRSLAKREADRFVKESAQKVVGRATGGILNPDGSAGSVRGFQGESIRETRAAYEARWTAMRKRAEADARASVVDLLESKRHTPPASATPEEVILRLERGKDGRGSPTPNPDKPGGTRSKDPFQDWLDDEFDKLSDDEKAAIAEDAAYQYTPDELAQMESDAREWRSMMDEGQSAANMRKLEQEIGPILTPEDKARIGIPGRGDIDGAKRLVDRLRMGDLSENAARVVRGDLFGLLAQDTRDILNEADDNVWRQLLYEALRLVESMIGLTSRHSRKGSAADAVAYIVGPTEDGRKTKATNARRDGWRLNANNIRLSVVAHIRAMHRRTTVTLARAYGIESFMMESASKHRGKISPTGLCGQQLWRVRTWDEWLDVANRANTGRIASSAFDSLGLGYGDCTYLVPVPNIYRADAIAYGQKMRARWISTEKQQPAAKRPVLRRAA